MRNAVVFGAGGFGREVAWLIRRNNQEESKWNLLGMVDDDPSLRGQSVDGYPILGTMDWIKNFQDDLCVFSGIGTGVVRRSTTEIMSAIEGITFPTLVSHDAIVSDRVKMGQGCIICASTIITTDVLLGNFVTINLDCTIGHDAVLEDYVQLQPSVNISGFDTIKTCAQIGTGVHVIQGLTIGERSIVGAGTVVIKDVPEDCTAVGNPSRIVHDARSSAVSTAKESFK